MASASEIERFVGQILPTVIELAMRSTKNIARFSVFEKFETLRSARRETVLIGVRSRIIRAPDFGI
jgi:hypothetical protein